jgi:hypothetical protein
MQDRRSGGDGGKIEWKLSKINTRAVSRGQNELKASSSMAADDVMSVRG